MTELITELRDALVKSIGSALNETKQGIIEDFRRAGVDTRSPKGKEEQHGTVPPNSRGSLAVDVDSQLARLRGRRSKQQTDQKE